MNMSAETTSFDFRRPGKISVVTKAIVVVSVLDFERFNFAAVIGVGSM